jgi:hypothetical protein
VVCSQYRANICIDAVPEHANGGVIIKTEFKGIGNHAKQALMSLFFC